MSKRWINFPEEAALSLQMSARSRSMFFPQALTPYSRQLSPTPASPKSKAGKDAADLQNDVEGSGPNSTGYDQTESFGQPGEVSSSVQLPRNAAGTGVYFRVATSIISIAH